MFCSVSAELRRKRGYKDDVAERNTKYIPVWPAHRTFFKTHHDILQLSPSLSFSLSLSLLLAIYELSLFVAALNSGTASLGLHLYNIVILFYIATPQFVLHANEAGLYNMLGPVCGDCIRRIVVVNPQPTNEPTNHPIILGPRWGCMAAVRQEDQTRGWQFVAICIV